MADPFDWESNSTNIPFQKHMLAGSIAGMSEHCFVFPFDTLKVLHIQTYAQAESPGALKSSHTRKLVLTKGYFQLWKGVSPVVIGSIPAHAVYFSIYQLSKSWFGIKSNNNLHFYPAMLTGALAAFSHDIFMTPLDGIYQIVVKQRMQLQGTLGTIPMIKKIIKSEGPFSLYRSLPVTVLMNMPQAMTFMSIYQGLKSTFFPQEVTLTRYFLCAGVAAALAAGFTTPMDVVKTRLQTQQHKSLICGNQGVERNHNKYQNISNTISLIYSQEGLRGFMKGLFPRMLFVFPGAGISWLTYEYAKRLLIA